MVSVTLIVPVYNTERYLKDCIESIITQTFTNFELLLVDDGSTDNSGEICDYYAQLDSRIKVFHQKNGGVTSARRLGVENAMGEFITFVDSDDTVDNNYISTLLSQVKKDVDIVVTKISDEKINDCLCSNREFIKNVLLGYIARGVPAKLYRKTLFTNSTFCLSPSFKVGEDEIMNLRVGIHAKNVRCLNKKIYTYRHNLESVTATTNFSLQYEEMLMDELKKSLGVYSEMFESELRLRDLLTLENLIVCRVNVPYSRRWVRELILWSSDKKLTFRQWCVLNIRCNIVCKYILAIEKRFRKICAKVF